VICVVDHELNLIVDDLHKVSALIQICSVSVHMRLVRSSKFFLLTTFVDILELMPSI
jgi:hypothetical protein